MTKIIAIWIYPKNLFPKHISLTTGCFFYPMLKIDIWEKTKFPIGKMLKSRPSLIKIQVLFSDEIRYHYPTIPFICSLARTALDVYSVAISLRDHQTYCPKLLSNWSEHTEDLIPAYKLYCYGTKAYRWKLLNSGNWQVPVT